MSSTQAEELKNLFQCPHMHSLKELYLDDNELESEGAVFLSEGMKVVDRCTLSYIILSYIILSYLVISYLILSYLNIPYLILSSLMLTYLLSNPRMPLTVHFISVNYLFSLLPIIFIQCLINSIITLNLKRY